MNKVLVVVDIQKNFIKQCGGERILPEVAEKIREREKEGYEILLTYDKSGGELCESVVGLCEGRKIFRKRSYGCEELILYLKSLKPEAVEFIGVCTDICVMTNVLAAITFLPFSLISVDGKCCAAESAEGHAAALKLLNGCSVTVV